MITILDFSAERPAVHRRLLPNSAAQSAVNCHTERHKVQPLFRPKQDGVAHYNPPASIFRQREDGYWLDWQTDVDVIRSPLETDGYPDTLIYTGDGRPKIRAVGSTIAYDLGLPAPVSAPVAAAIADSNSGKILNIQRKVLTTYSAPFMDEADYVNVDRYALFDNFGTFQVTADGDTTLNFDFKTTINYTYIDPQGDDGVTFDVIVTLLRDSEEVTRTTIGTAYGYPFFPPVDLNSTFVDKPAAGTYSYKFRVELANGNNGMRCQANMSTEVRINDVMQIQSDTRHNLRVDARVTINDVTATGDMPTQLNGKVFTVSAIVNDYNFEISALINGTYTSGGTWTEFWSAAEIESRNYRYTYVATINGVDYEGPASDPSDGVDAGQGQEVQVTGFSAFPGTWNSPVDRIRIYRYAATSSTTGQYQFLAEIPIATSAYSDTVLTENLGESLPDPDREPPPETLAGIIELPNGGAAAFSGKTVWLAEPNFLHAWPPAYARNAHDDVVAIGAFGSSIAVATKSQPYVINGVDPASMTMDKIELSQPCLSKRGCVDLGYAWVYPSPDGLVLVTTGRAEVISLPLFTEFQWRDLNPTSFRAARYENRYVAFYEKVDGTKGGFMFNPLDLEKGVIFIDLWVDALWTDPSDGSLYVAQANVIKKFDADVLEMDMTWRSKEYITPMIALTAARIEAEVYPISFSIYGEGQEVFSRQVYSKQSFRVKTPLGSAWSFEVRGQHTVEAILIAESMGELGHFGGGG